MPSKLNRICMYASFLEDNAKTIRIDDPKNLPFKDYVDNLTFASRLEKIARDLKEIALGE